MKIRKYIAGLMCAAALAASGEDWGGRRAEFLGAYKKLVETGGSDSYTVIKPEVSYLHVVGRDELSDGKAELGRAEPFVNGTAMLAKMHYTNYTLVTPVGIMAYTTPEKLFEEDEFNAAKKMYNSGGRVQMLGFSDSTFVPKKNAIILHPGRTPKESILEEKLGQLDPALNPKLSVFGRRIASRMYAPRANTMLPGKELGYLVDVYAPGGATDKYNKRIFPRLKQFIPVSSEKNDRIPQFIMTKITQMRAEDISEKMKELLKNHDHVGMQFVNLESSIIDLSSMKTLQYRTECVVDDNLENKDEGIFSRFDPPILIEGINKY